MLFLSRFVFEGVFSKADQRGFWVPYGEESGSDLDFAVVFRDDSIREGEADGLKE